jgi:hypothetical protein
MLQQKFIVQVTTLPDCDDITPFDGNYVQLTCVAIWIKDQGLTYRALTIGTSICLANLLILQLCLILLPAV